MRRRASPATAIKAAGHTSSEVPMPEFIGATLGAAIAVAVIALAWQRWGYSS